MNQRYQTAHEHLADDFLAIKNSSYTRTQEKRFYQWCQIECSKILKTNLQLPMSSTSTAINLDYEEAFNDAVAKLITKSRQGNLDFAKNKLNPLIKDPILASQALLNKADSNYKKSLSRLIGLIKTVLKHDLLYYLKSNTDKLKIVNCGDAIDHLSGTSQEEQWSYEFTWQDENRLAIKILWETKICYKIKGRIQKLPHQQNLMCELYDLVEQEGFFNYSDFIEYEALSQKYDCKEHQIRYQVQKLNGWIIKELIACGLHLN